MVITEVRVEPARVKATISFAADEHLRTSAVPGLAAAVIDALPGLRGHRCDTAGVITFSEEVADTELAHLVEHVALELMAMAGSPDTLRGETEWDFARDGHGTFSVSLEYDDDLVCIAAISAAAAAVDDLASGRAFDARSAASALEAVRRRARG